MLVEHVLVWKGVGNTRGKLSKARKITNTRKFRTKGKRPP